MEVSTQQASTGNRGNGAPSVAGNPGPVGMTNLRVVQHLDMGGGGWTDSSDEGPAVKLSYAERQRTAVD